MFQNKHICKLSHWLYYATQEICMWLVVNLPFWLCFLYFHNASVKARRTCRFFTCTCKSLLMCYCPFVQLGRILCMKAPKWWQVWNENEKHCRWHWYLLFIVTLITWSMPTWCVLKIFIYSLQVWILPTYRRQPYFPYQPHHRIPLAAKRNCLKISFGHPQDEGFELE